MVSATAGVEVGTEKVWDYAEDLPKMIFVNKMDQENADFSKVLASLKDKFGTSIVALQLPLGQEADFSGVVDLITMKAYKYEGGKRTEVPVPAELEGDIETLREEPGAVAVTDEDLLERYLGGEDIAPEEIAKAVAVGTKQGDVIPVLCGSASTEVGCERVFGCIGRLRASPLDAGCKPERSFSCSGV